MSRLGQAKDPLKGWKQLLVKTGLGTLVERAPGKDRTYGNKELNGDEGHEIQHNITTFVAAKRCGVTQSLHREVVELSEDFSCSWPPGSCVKFSENFGCQVGFGYSPATALF